MVVESDVDIVEPAVAHEIGTAHELFFGRTAKYFERASEAEFLHCALRRERGADQHRGVDVVAFAVAGRAFDNELLLRHAGALRIVRTAVVFGVDRDHRMAGTISGAEAGGESRYAALDLETAFFQQAGHEFRSLELLHTEFAEIENIVAELRYGAGVALDVIEDVPL